MKIKFFIAVVLMIAIGACTAPNKVPYKAPSENGVNVSNPGADPNKNESDKAVELSFAPGASSATVEDTLRLGAIHDYLVRASAGQALKAIVTSNGPATIVVIDNEGYQSDAVHALPSDSEEKIIDRANGEAVLKGYVWEGSLPRSGVYRVRVIHSEPAVNEGAVSPCSLTVEIK